jgi:hypothetical protein
MKKLKNYLLLLKIKNFLQFKNTLIKRSTPDPFSKVTIKLKNKNFFEKLNDIIISNIKTNITIDKIATELFISKSALDKSGAWENSIVTTIEPFKNYYPAEKYHQNYYNDNTNQGYCRFVIAPKLEKFEKVFKEKLKKHE